MFADHVRSRREGNAFSRVCDSFQRGGGGGAPLLDQDR